MLDKHAARLTSLSPAEAGLVCSELRRRSYLPAEPPGSTATADPALLPSLLDGCQILTADVIAVLLPHPSPLAQNALEKLMGRPITCLPAQASPPPPPPHEGAKPVVEEIGLTGRRTIHNIVANPKRAGTGAAVRYALYREGMTVAEYIRAGGEVRDIAWDSRQKYIEVRDGL